METIKKQIAEQLEKVQSQLRMIESGNCVERCNWIAMFESNGLAISKDENNKPVISNKLFASQWERETAELICKNVSNGNGEYPVIVNAKTYYSKKQEILIDTLKIFN